MLTVSNLSVDYGSHRVVEDLDLTLDDSEILMLVGPTGCGKSTILQAIAGLIPVAEGSISLASEWTSTAKKPIAPEKRNIGMVFQDFALFPHLTVEQNVCFRLKDKTLANHWINLLGLSDFRHSKPVNLSGGQKQRVALARTLAHEPKLILLDEPLSNLDAALKDSLRWEIRSALKEAGVPAIWVTHDQEEALSVGDRVGVLLQGKLQQLAPPETCYCEPENRFVARFLGEASFISGQVEESSIRTLLGQAPIVKMDNSNGTADLLLRPDDLSITVAQNGGNGEVKSSRYEGGSRLYHVAVDGGEEVAVRVSHESHINVGERVQLQITTTHPLAAFKPQQD